jgi:hypothetical protein
MGFATFHLDAGRNHPTSFTNHYEWGDLKANPSNLLGLSLDNTHCNFISCFQAFSRNWVKTAGVTLELLRDKCAAVR